MLHLTTSDQLSEEDIDRIGDPLRHFNADQNPVFWSARELPANAARPLYVVARAADAGLVGGLIAETYFAWLKVSIMAVIPSARRTGVGSRLLAAAEEEAVRRGCRRAYVDTMDYQAPAFYEKRGYRIVGRLEDWDSHGHAKLFFVKNLR